MVEHRPVQGLQRLGAAETTCWAFSSPSQGSLELEAGWGEQLPLGLGQFAGSPEGALSSRSCGSAEHKAAEARAGARGSARSLRSPQDPSSITLCFSPAVCLLHGLGLNYNPSREGTVFRACAQHRAPRWREPFLKHLNTTPG